jgi:PAS domain S-box-containing protein
LTAAARTTKMCTVSMEPGPGDPPAPRATVLVASSDAATRDLLRRVLHVGAIDVVDASDGVEALAFARRLDLDLIVLDAFLAVMDGISVCSRVRALSDIDQPPILMVGLSSDRAVEVALTAGADETLAKPLNSALLRYRTRVLLVRREEDRRLRLLQRALEAAPAGMALLDARSSEYAVAVANPALLRLTGYDRDEIVGHDLRLLAGPATDVAAMTEMRQAMAEGRPSRALLKNYRKDRQPFWNDVAIAPVLDASGRLTHYVSVQSDVTRLVEAPELEAARAVEEQVAERTRELEATLARVEAQRRFAETVLNSMVSAILATDAKGTVTFANRAALRTLGTSLADCVGRSVVELFGHHEDVAEVVAGTVPAHSEHRLDFPMISPGGTRFYVGMSITPPPAEFRGEVGFIFLFRDLAETIDLETDPHMKLLASEQDTLHTALPDEPAPAASDGPPEAPPGAAVASHAAAATDEAAPRRMVLALRYTAPADVARAAIEALCGRLEGDGAFVRLETADDVPEVLLDRQQATEALIILLSSVLDRSTDPADVRVRITRAEAPDGRTGHPAPAVRLEILGPPATITEEDLTAPQAAEKRQPHRRIDLEIAEKLLEANGARLIRPGRVAGAAALTIVFRAAR